MPQMNGDQLVDRLKQIAAHVPMILLGDPQKMGGQMHGADALLAKKNCSSQELLERDQGDERPQARPAQRARRGWCRRNWRWRRKCRGQGSGVRDQIGAKKSMEFLSGNHLRASTVNRGFIGLHP